MISHLEYATDRGTEHLGFNFTIMSVITESLLTLHGDDVNGRVSEPLQCRKRGERERHCKQCV